MPWYPFSNGVFGIMSLQRSGAAAGAVDTSTGGEYEEQLKQQPCFFMCRSDRQCMGSGSAFWHATLNTKAAHDQSHGWFLDFKPPCRGDLHNFARTESALRANTLPRQVSLFSSTRI